MLDVLYYYYIGYIITLCSFLALKMRNRQHDIDWLDSQLESCKNDIEDLQNRLYDAEKLLVSDLVTERNVIYSYFL